MDTYRLPSLENQNIQTDRQRFEKMLREAEKKNEEAFKNTFLGYDSDKIIYRNIFGQQVFKGQSSMEKAKLPNSDYADGVYSDSLVFVDGVFEGGGAKGLAYLGGLHTLAHCGIWFARVAGTSAGSIAAALIAAGYKIDLGYELDVLVKPHNLEASPTNSLNKIMFEDSLARLADFSPSQDPATKDSWTSKAINETLEYVKFYRDLRDLEHAFEAANIIVSNHYEEISNSMREEIVENLRESLGGFSLLLEPVLFTDIVEATAKIYIQEMHKRLSKILPDNWGNLMLKDLIKINGPIGRAVRGAFRLFEHGGVFTGDVLRDWIQNHLSAKVPGSGKNGLVLFRDLPMPLAVTATDVGSTDDPASPSLDQLMVFSNKATPDYPVCEAVRRSVSLPFAFYPKLLNEGFGNNPSNIRSSFTQLSAIQKGLLNNYQNKSVSGVSPVTIVDNITHHNHVLLDGGFRNNLPVGIFRDQANRYMDGNYARNEPVRFLVAFNLNDLMEAPQRPHGLPPLNMPEPFASFAEILSSIGSEDSTQQNEDAETWDLKPSEGMKRAGLAIHQTADFLLGGRSEQEITELLSQVPKTVVVNVPMIDPDTDKDSYGSRIGGLDFGVPKITKKWWSHSSWQAAQTTLNDLSKRTGVSIGIDEKIQPYQHNLTISNLTPSGYLLEDVETALRKSPFVDDDTYFYNSASGFSNALEYFWSATLIRTRQADFGNSNNQLVQFTVNIPVRVTLFVDIEYTHLPGFMQQWTDARSQIQFEQNIWRNRYPSRPSFILKAYYRNFPAGPINLGGPRSGGGAGNRLNYIILITPR